MATVAAGAVLGGAVAAAPAWAEPVGYRRIGRPGWPIRLRTGIGTVDGRPVNVHGSGRSFRFDPVFHATCDDWATYVHAMWTTYGSPTNRLEWIGCSHVYRPYPAGSNHTTGNALDLTAMHFRGGDYIDCRFSHHPWAPAVHQRRYAGLAWTGRRFFPELGVAGTGPSHAWHIHMGRWVDGAASILLRRSSWDTWLVQRTCRVLMRANLALDGVWGARTERLFRALLDRLGLADADPFRDESHFATLAHRVVAHCFAGRPA